MINEHCVLKDSKPAKAAGVLALLLAATAGTTASGSDWGAFRGADGPWPSPRRRPPRHNLERFAERKVDGCIARSRLFQPHRGRRARLHYLLLRLWRRQRRRQPRKAARSPPP